MSASRDSSWPRQLGRLLDESVYNMALGGYGPLQYLELARASAPKLQPRLLIVGFYFGNDLMDSFYLAHDRAAWHSWRLSGDAMAGVTPSDIAGQAEPHKHFAALRNWLARHSLLYSALRATVLQPFAIQEQDRMAQAAGADTSMLWTDPGDPTVRTIFKPRHRLAAIDLGLAPVREGMDISKRALSEMKRDAGRNEVGLLTVLIPTKERAYCRYLELTKANLPDSFSKLCGAEAKAARELTSFLIQEGIAHVDALPALEANVSRHVQVYPVGSDGHPVAAGYAVIAGELAKVVRQRFPRP